MKGITNFRLFTNLLSVGLLLCFSTVQGQEKKSGNVAVGKQKSTTAKTGNSKQHNSGFIKNHGLEYKIVKDAPGKNATMGEFVIFNLIAKVDTTELGNTYKKGKPGEMLVEEARNNGDLISVLPYLSAGDSALVHISCDTIINSIPVAHREQAQKMQPWLISGNTVNITIKVIAVKSKDEMQNDKKVKAAQQSATDDKLLQEYFAKNKIKAEKTASGLYYSIQSPGNGLQINSGQSVSMKYTGRTLDDKPFDSNIDTAIGHHGTDPLTFTVGTKQMIPGVDEAVALLKNGTKATLYLPSGLGYGEQAGTNIGANTALIFDIEITDVH